MPRLFSVAVFNSFIYHPIYSNFKKYEDFGLSSYNTISFHVHNAQDNVQLGVWHILPYKDRLDYEMDDKDDNDNEAEEMIKEQKKQQQDDMESSNDQSKCQMNNIDLTKYFKMKLANGKPIVLYMHGNMLTRAATSRLPIYDKLTSKDIHVITMDYRGYGDSTGRAWTENEVVSDALSVYQYIINKTKKNPDSKIYLWGHSIATGIASVLAKNITQSNDRQAIQSLGGVILETPYLNIREAGRNHPYGLMYKFTPYFEYMLDGFERTGLIFNNEENLKQVVHCPILILHAEDDKIVLYSDGVKLFNTLKQTGIDVELHSYNASLNYGHIWIGNDPYLGNRIRQFIDKSQSSFWRRWLPFI